MRLIKQDTNINYNIINIKDCTETSGKKERKKEREKREEARNKETATSRVNLDVHRNYGISFQRASH